MGRRNVENIMKLPPGLDLNKGTNGGIRIAFVYKGVRCRETLKIKPTKTNIKFAGGLRARIVHEIAVGTFNYVQHFPDSPKVALFGGRKNTVQTIGEALDKYLLSVKRTTATSTWRDYKSAINFHLKPAFGDMLLQRLSKSDIMAWFGTLDISNKRINNVLVPLRGMLAVALEDGVIDKDPTATIKNLKVAKVKPDPFTLNEIGIILNEASGQARNLFQFAFFTGMRTGELIALEWGDVDWNLGTVSVSRNSVRKEVKAPKTDAGNRDVLLLPQAMEALESQKQYTFLEGQRIFHNPRTNRPWETDAQIRRTSWEHILKRTGVRYRVPYQTRHTYASQLLTAGENPMWIAAQMGHEDWGLIRKRYGKWIPSTDPTAGQKAGQLLINPVKACSAGEAESIRESS